MFLTTKSLLKCSVLEFKHITTFQIFYLTTHLEKMLILYGLQHLNDMEKLLLILIVVFKKWKISNCDIYRLCADTLYNVLFSLQIKTAIREEMLYSMEYSSDPGIQSEKREGIAQLIDANSHQLSKTLQSEITSVENKTYKY